MPLQHDHRLALIDYDGALKLLQKTAAAMNQAPDLETALRYLLEQICMYTAWEYGEVWWRTGQHPLENSGVWYAQLPDVAPEDGHWLGRELSQRVIQQTEAEWLEDVIDETNAFFPQPQLVFKPKLQSALGIPVIADHQVVMVLVFAATTARACQLEEVRLLKAIAEQVSAHLQLKQAEAQLLAHQEQLQRLIDTLPGIVFTAKGPPDWQMRSLSDGCLQLLGYTSHDLISEDSSFSYNDVTHPDDLPRVLQKIQLALTQSRSYEVEYRVRTRSGETKWVWEKGQGVLAETGTVVGLEGFITDITALKQTEAALRESETRYRLLAEQSQDLISQHDLQGVFRYVSPACYSLLGYAPEELIGRSPQEFLHPQEETRIIHYYRQLLRQQTAQTLRFQVRHRNGNYRWFETISCMINQGRAVGGFQVLAVSRDITERVQAEQELIKREQFLRLVLDNIPQHLFWKDRNGIYLGCNHAFAESVGLADPREVTGRSDAAISHYSAEQAQQFRQQDLRIMQSDWPEIGMLETSQEVPQRWLSCSKFPIHDAQQQVVGILGILEDVSDRIAFQKTLNRREQYLSVLVELQQQLLDWDDAWEHERFGAVLQPLGAVTEADRVYIYDVSAAHPNRLVQRAQWTAPHITPTLGYERLSCFAVEGAIAPWVAELQQGNCVNQTIDQFPLPLQQLLGGPPAEVKSILLLPLKIGGAFSGMIGFTNCQAARVWSRSEVTLLQVAANAIAIAKERFQTAVSLSHAENKYRSIVENAVEGIFQTSPEGCYITVNPMLAQIYGYDSPQDLIESLTDIGQQLYVDTHRRNIFIQEMLKAGAVIGFESAVYRKDGSVIWISESARTIYGHQGQVIGFEGTVEDITARKQSEAELFRRDRLLQGVAQASKQLLTNLDIRVSIPKILAILGTAADADRIYIYENHPHSLTGLPAMSMRYEWTQTTTCPRIHQSHWQDQAYEQYGLMRWYRAFQAGQTIRGQVQTLPMTEQQLLAKDEIQSILMVPIFIDQDLWGYIGFDACREARDWTPVEESILVTSATAIGGALKWRDTEEQMRYQAFHDPLTALPNRTAFNQQLPRAIAAATRSKTQIAVMFLDLDRFKNINDTLGHAIGDKLLIEATQRLKCGLRKDDMLARWGGDEFTLILQNITSMYQAEKVAERLAASLKPAFVIENQELYVTGSIGIAIYPTDGTDVKTLLQHADAAMYAAKADGRNTHRFYNTSLNSGASQQLLLEKHLHQALQRAEFKLAFQPQIDLQAGKICRIEALIRWHSPELGTVPPNNFIAVAEEIGLIIELGDWVLRQACCQLQIWHQQGFEDLGIAVNLSARQLQQPSLVRNVKQVLDAFDLTPSSLELEITETAALSNIDASIATLNQLRELGTRIVMDDFGTGYSSLNYLKRLPFLGLKIDRSFVKDIPTDPQDVAMLRAMIALGHELQLEIVAEGVETPEQMKCLQELGCHNMQGYWFSHPLEAAATTTFLQTHWPRYNAESIEV